MNELRKDYLTDDWVIIAKNRGKRPDHFRKEYKAQQCDNPKDCCFCPGNENMNPPEIARIEENGRWIARAVPNKYPAAQKYGPHHIETHNHFFTFAYAYGSHEVIIETESHSKQLEDLPVEKIARLIEFYIERITELSKNQNIQYVALYKNRGVDAAASLQHSHSQIIAYNQFPKSVEKKIYALEKCFNASGRCAYCDIINAEKKSDRRVYENDTFAAFTPYASKHPFELAIFPKRHIASMTDLDRKEIHDFAQILKKSLLRLRDLGDISYNLLYYTTKKNEKFHFHIHIVPWLAKWAGFEYETETIINVMPPELAAKFYRGEE